LSLLYALLVICGGGRLVLDTLFSSHSFIISRRDGLRLIIKTVQTGVKIFRCSLLHGVDVVCRCCNFGLGMPDKLNFSFLNNFTTFFLFDLLFIFLLSIALCLLLV